MTGSFLDSTIVIHVSDPSNQQKAKSESCVANNQPSQTPYYALRELLAGHFQNLCDAHNAISAAENLGEAGLHLSIKYALSGRKFGSKQQVLFETLATIYKQNTTGARDQMKQEALTELALRINRLWRKAHNIGNVELVQSLACFNDGKIEYGAAGELRAPNNSFNCIPNQRCAAAAYLFDNKDDLKKMIEALHPDNLDSPAKNKQENVSRRKALKELESKGSKDFDKGRCRALGDAYFAAMCPAGKLVMTSNSRDFIPLCNALGKNVLVP